MIRSLVQALGRRSVRLALALPLVVFSGAAPLAACSDSTGPDGCCRICREGKACGDSCIERSKACNVGPGCACNG